MASTSPTGSPTITLTGFPAGPAGIARTRSGPALPARAPGTITASPASARRSSPGRSSGVSRSRSPTPDHPRLAVHDLDHLRPDRDGFGNRCSSTIAATRRALARPRCPGSGSPRRSAQQERRHPVSADSTPASRWSSVARAGSAPRIASRDTAFAATEASR